MQLDIIVPVVMSCALLWWVSRGMSWTTRLVVTAITLVVIICILLFERSGHLRSGRASITTSAARRIAQIPAGWRIARTSVRDAAASAC